MNITVTTSSDPTDRVNVAAEALHRAIYDYGIAIGNGWQVPSIDTTCDAADAVRDYIRTDYAHGKFDGLVHYYGEGPTIAND
jgi:hypothetical protein